jgi:hypothetical protein
MRDFLLEVHIDSLCNPRSETRTKTAPTGIHVAGFDSFVVALGLSAGSLDQRIGENGLDSPTSSTVRAGSHYFSMEVKRE